MAGYKHASNEAKKAVEVAQKKSNNWFMVSFIHNGSEIQLGWGIASKTNSTKSNATF